MKQNQYEIIVLDLDGTLTNRDKVITPRTKKALMEAQARGKKVVLASGRPTQGVMPLAEELDLKAYGGFILSYNGGMITNCKTGETVFSSPGRWYFPGSCRWSPTGPSSVWQRSTGWIF